MQLKELLKDMNIQHEIFGNDYFESLGLASAVSDKELCTFISDAKYAAEISSSIKLIITTTKNKEKLKKYNVCVVEDPKNTFFMLHNYLSTKEDYKRPSFDTVISKNAKIHKLSCIAQKNVIIEEGAVIEEFVSIKENTIIGKNSIIRAGSIIGGEGFEFKKKDDKLYGITHLGGVHIRDCVEIQQNSCIDKAIYPWDNTVLDNYTKIDNNVHIAHGVKIGKRVMIVANSGVGGRVEIGDDCWIGFNVTIRNGIKIGSDSRANMGAVVTKNVSKGSSVTGNFAIEHKTFIENLKKNI